MNSHARQFVLKSLLILGLNVFSGAVLADQIGSDPLAREALGQCLKQTGAVMFGTSGCGHCKRQMEMFGESFRNVEYVDCRKNSANAKRCNDARVGKFPQWNFPQTGRQLVRENTLDDIARASGCESYVAQALQGRPTQLPLTATMPSQALAPSGVYQNQPNSPQSYGAAASSASFNQAYGTPEDLALCLKEKNVIFYGSPNCSHCNKQKEMFEGAFERYLLPTNFHNCKGSAAEQAECSRLQTFPFPSWVEPATGKKLTGPERRLDVIANTFGCTLAARRSTQQNYSASQPLQPQFAQFGNGYQNNISTNQTQASSLNLPNTSQVQQAQQTPADIHSAAPIATTQTVASTQQLTQTPPFEDSSFNPSGGFPSAAASSQPQTIASASISPTSLQMGNSPKLQLMECLKTKQVQLFGIGGQATTQRQLDELGEFQSHIKVVDCAKGDAGCENLLVFPTWIIENEGQSQYLPGFLEINDLARASGCPIMN